MSCLDVDAGITVSEVVSVQGTGRRLLDRYALLELIGQSATTLVWRARDERAGREVAVKEFRMPPTLDDVEQAVLARKLVRIGQDAARFTHPGAVEVYEVFEVSGTPFVVMELFDGPTLAQVVADRGTLAPDVAADIGRQLLTTLAAAHCQGVVHRGVRPGNVVLVDESKARLTDFATASVVPTPEGGRSPFCAPEQTTTTGAGPAADLWSLGATLHYAVEGTPPNRQSGESSAASGNGSSELGPVLDALLTRDPARRPDAATTAHMLYVAAGQTPLAAEPEPERAADLEPETAAEPEAESEAAPQSVSDAEPEASPPGPEAAPEDTIEPTEPAADVSPGASAPEDGDEEAVRTVREPWFFPVPVEVQPGSELVTLTAADAGDVPPPKPAASRFYGGAWVTILAVGMSLFLLVALVLVRGTSVLHIGKKTSSPVPADWVTYEEPVVGYSISHPVGWKVTRVGPATEIRDPSTEAVLRVDAATPSGLSPRATALSLEKAFGGQVADYRRIRLLTSRFHGYPASVWEYTYSAGGNQMHAVQLGVLTDTQRLTLLFESKAADWERHQHDLAGFEASFRGF